MSLILFNVHDIILLITVYQCLIFSILIFFIRQKTLRGNLYLVGFLLASAAIPLDILINYGAGIRDWIVTEHPYWLYIFEFGYWLQGPFLLWYIRSLVYKNFTLGWWDVLYLSPFLLYFPHQFVNYHLLPSDVKAQIHNASDLIIQSTTVFYINMAREFLHVFFGVNCIIELRRYHMQVKKRYSSLDSVDFTWLNLLVYGFLVLWGWAFINAALVLYAVEQAVVLNVSVMGLIANYATCLLMGVVMVFVSSRSSALTDIERINSHIVSRQKVQINLDHVHALELLMEEEKPYLDPLLTLDNLAAKLSLTSRVLSQTINRHYGCNFFEFINKYRIDTTKKMLLSDDHRSSTVLDIMHDAGFNSKATFNNFFKKSEGMTPREYKKKNQKSTTATIASDDLPNKAAL